MLSRDKKTIEKLVELLRNLKHYVIVQTNGQRKICKIREDCVPPKGCEIFIGKLPKDIYEDYLFPILMLVGPVHEFRLMVDYQTRGRGYAFASFYNEETALFAIRALNGFEIKPGYKIGVYRSINNCRLFVGNIPRHVTREDLKLEMDKYCERIKAIIMYPSVENIKENRGYAFIEFASHQDAAIARRKFTPGSLNLWGVDILVDWADPLPEPDAELMSQVKKLYIRNLPTHMKNTDLWKHLATYPQINLSDISRVYTHNDYAFIHFENRDAAQVALNALRGAKIGGRRIEIMWARPREYSKEVRQNATPDHFCISLPPRQRKEVVKLKNEIRKVRKMIPTPEFSWKDLYERLVGEMEDN